MLIKKKRGGGFQEPFINKNVDILFSAHHTFLK